MAMVHETLSLGGASQEISSEDLGFDVVCKITAD
jgi:hypothetical protein